MPESGCHAGGTGVSSLNKCRKNICSATKTFPFNNKTFVRIRMNWDAE